MSVNTEENMVTELQSLLEQQIELVKHGNSAGGRIEVLSAQADSIVHKIKRAKILEQPGFENQRKQLQELYDSLYLSLTCQKAEVADKLGNVRRVRKIVGKYRNNIDL